MMNQPLPATMRIELSPFKKLIKNRCGLVFSNSRETILLEGLLARMSERGFSSDLAYFSDLDNNSEEFGLLLELLLINETYFFREPTHLKLLQERLIPEMLKKQAGRGKLRILSCGCSTGEEVHSVAMALIEQYGDEYSDFFSVTGVDIDEDAIEKARQGIYSGNAFRSIGENLKERFFDRIDGSRYEIKDGVKETVSFAKFNLNTESYPPFLQRMDVIFYRNVSIYFDEETRRRIFLELSQALNDTGYLVVSSTETISHDMGILPLVEIGGVFLFQKNPPPDAKIIRGVGASHMSAQSSRPTIPTQPSEKRAAPRPEKVSIRHRIESPSHGESAKAGMDRSEDHKEDGSDLLEALSFAKDKHYDDALTILNGLIDKGISSVKAFTLKANILINLQQLTAAERSCSEALAVDALNLESYLLLGLIAKYKDKQEDALSKFKEAAYVEPSCWLAHFYQAEIYRMRDDIKQAQQRYGMVVKLLEKGRFHAHGLPLSPFAFSKEQMLHLCRRHLVPIERSVNS